MSWGYLLDVRLSLPDDAWARLAGARAGDHPTSPGWWGFREADLAHRFTVNFDGGRGFDDWTFERVIRSFSRPESIGSISSDGGITSVRVASLLDRSGETYIARSFAALFEAARAAGGSGSVSLINDGTYSGEDGVTVTLAKGKLTKKVPVRRRAS
jgi:hypothetical protein